MRTFVLMGVGLSIACDPGPARKPEVVRPVASAKAAEREPRVTKRVVVSLTRPSGTSVTTVAPDGTIGVVLDVLENGRGPHVEATLRLAADGTIASLDARGHHTMGTAVAETFAREGKHARWKSLEEQGERDVDGGAFFVPMADLPDAMGLLAEALLAAPGHTLPLLPSGEAHLERMGEASVAPDGGGAPRHLVGYSISGMDLTPVYIWLGDDGRWFGSVSPWFSVVPDGWQKAIEPLIALQKGWTRELDARLAAATAHKPPAAGIAFTHARVLDVERGRWLADHTVVVAGDRIASVGPAARATIPAGAEVVDLAGKAIVPGLWDMHSHLGDADGTLDIASGVTTARDVGNEPDKLDDFKKRYDEGSAVGPRVIRFGFIEGRGEKAASSTVTAETEDEAKAAVELFAKRGYEGIKIYNSMKPALVPLLAKEAHARGMMVTGHIPVHMLAHEAVEGGYDGIEHINMLFLNFFADHDTDTRTTLRFSLVGDKAAAFDLAGAPVRDFFKLLKERHTVVDPTLDAFEGLLVGEPGKVIAGLESVTARLPVQAQRWFLLGGLPLGDKRDLYRASFDKMLAMVKALHDGGIHVVVGTDGLGGLMLQHELALYVRAGISTADTLKMATLEAARAMKLDGKSGSIAAGKAADLFVVDGDPLARIDDVAKVVTTMRGGVAFPSAPLYQAVGVRPTP